VRDLRQYPDTPNTKTEAMDPAHIERLKQDWTGRRVTVASNDPALRRFVGTTGTVVTVNMNGRALVRFDSSADIGWYDIALSDLRAAMEPAPAETKPPGEPPTTSASKPEVRVEASPATPTDKPKSILELARQQGAAKRK